MLQKRPEGAELCVEFAGGMQVYRQSRPVPFSLIEKQCSHLLHGRLEVGSFSHASKIQEKQSRNIDFLHRPLLTLMVLRVHVGSALFLLAGKGFHGDRVVSDGRESLLSISIVWEFYCCKMIRKKRFLFIYGNCLYPLINQLAFELESACFVLCKCMMAIYKRSETNSITITSGQECDDGLVCELA